MTLSRLVASDVVLVVVDMQERLLSVIHEGEQVMANTRLLLRAASALEVPVLLTTQYAKGLGPTHSAISELIPGASPTDKLTFSCFGSGEFKSALDATRRGTLLLAGVEAHICVLQTGLDAIASGLQVHVLADATGSRTARNAELGRRRLERDGAVVSSTEMAIYEMLGASGTPAFKSLLPFFK